MNINIKKLKENAVIPEYKTKGAACFDFVTANDFKWEIREVSNVLVFIQTIIETGLAFEIPEGYRLDIYPRSGNAFKYNIQLANGTGKIDSDYRGEVKIKLIGFVPKERLNEVMQGIKKGTRIAQGEINSVKQVKFISVKKLSETQRGEKGFGSTGN